MKRMEGVYMFIMENSAGDPVLHGPAGMSAMPNPYDGEDLIATQTALGMTPLIVTHRTDDDEATRRRVNAMRRWAIRSAKRANKRVELIYIGPNGREHVDWVDPDE